MKKTLSFTLISVLCLNLVGCGVTEKITEEVAEEAAEKIIESSTNSEVDLNDNELSVTTEEGSVKIGEDVDLPDDFPKDVPVYKNAKVASSYVSANNEVNATLTSGDDYTTIKEYYRSEIEKQGWTIDDAAEFNMGTSSITYTCSQGDRKLNVGIFSAVENKDISIVLSVL